MIVNRKNKVVAPLVFIVIMVEIVSCSFRGERLVVSVADNNEQYAHLSLNGGVEQFDVNVTRASNWEWPDGTVIYLQFKTGGNNVVSGYARYSRIDNLWRAYYSGILDGTGTCEVYFFENTSTVDTHNIILRKTNAVYAAKDGVYINDNDALVVNASLIPVTSRIRFKGESGMSIKVSGISAYTSFDVDKNELVADCEPVELRVNNDGYTPYVYCVFDDVDDCTMGIEYSVDGNSLKYSRTFDHSVLNVGKSGYLTIPTDNTNKGWNFREKEKHFSVSGVTFTMKLIEAGTFNIGSTSSDSYESPVHRVSISNYYYIGETEVTQALWKVVTGYSPSQASGYYWDTRCGLGDDYPAYFISYDDVLSFITKLNNMTGATFRMPTEAEWEFAAKGGNESKGYKYSGSDTIDDVAWYVSDSEDKTHPVKMKQPNELGLYDMSGNVWEWCSDWFGYYDSSAKTNPKGPASGTARVNRGGCCDNEPTCCRPSFRNSFTPDTRYYSLGFRLALSE